MPKRISSVAKFNLLKFSILLILSNVNIFLIELFNHVGVVTEERELKRVSKF